MQPALPLPDCIQPWALYQEHCTKFEPSMTLCLRVMSLNGKQKQEDVDLISLIIQVSSNCAVSTEQVCLKSVNLQHSMMLLLTGQHRHRTTSC